MPYTIAALKTRYIVPLEFDGVFDYLPVVKSAIETLTKLGWEPTSPYVSGEADVYYHLVHEFDGKSDGQLDYNNMGFYFHNTKLSSAPIELLAIAKDGDSKNLRILIKDAGLYIFRTGIGLLWYEAQMSVLRKSGLGYIDDMDSQLDSETLRSFQYSFRVLEDKLKNYYLFDIKRKQYRQNQPTIYYKSDIEANIIDWLTCITKSIGASFLASRMKEKGFWPDKALLFTHVVFDDVVDSVNEDEDALQTAYALTNGYKSSAKMGPDFVSNVLFPFPYSIWSATKEGCGFFVWNSGKDKYSNIDYFCKENHITKVMNDYYAMYIRILYLSYSLHRFARIIASDNDISSYYEAFNIPEDAEKIYERIRNVDLNINIFLAKSMVTSVSHIHHQNDFYSYLIKRLRIKEDIKSVTSGLGALIELSDRTVNDKQRKLEDEAREKEKESDSRFQAGLGILSLLSIFSAIADAIAVSVYFKSFSDYFEDKGWLLFVNGSISFCIVLFIVAILISGPTIIKELKRIWRRLVLKSSS